MGFLILNHVKYSESLNIFPKEVRNFAFDTIIKTITNMKQKRWRTVTLAVALAAMSSQYAMGQQKSGQDIDWMKELTSRITFNGYAQGGWSYQNMNGRETNSYNLKRTTDGRSCSCTTSVVWYRNSTPIFA